MSHKPRRTVTCTALSSTLRRSRSLTQAPPLFPRAKRARAPPARSAIGRVRAGRPRRKHEHHPYRRPRTTLPHASAVRKGTVVQHGDDAEIFARIRDPAL